MNESRAETIDLVRRSLSAETERAFEKRLDEQAAWLREAITNGDLDNGDLTIGLEMEVYAVTSADDDGVTAVDTADSDTTGPDVTGSDTVPHSDPDRPRLARLPEAVFETPAANKELGTHNVEVNTEPTVLSGAGLRAQVEEIRTRTSAAQAAAREHDRELVLDGMWTLPPEEGTVEYLSAVTEPEGIVFAENMRQDPRYVAIDNHAREYADGRFPLSVPGVDLAFPTILFESLATSIQPHLQVPTAEAFPAYYNTAIRTLGPVLALCTNSPFLPADVYRDVADPGTVVDDTYHELRIPVFEQSVNQTPNAKVKVPRDIEQVADVVDNVRADDPYAPFLREWMEGETDRETLSDRLWEFDHKRGTYWRWLRCVIGGDPVDEHNTERSLRIEYRPIPTQPTVDDVIGVQTLVVGLIHGLVTADHPITDLPWTDAKAGFYGAMREGLDAELPWVTVDGDRTRDRAAVFDEVFTYARQGLADAGVPATDIESYLAPIEARWDARMTPSRWKKARVSDALSGGADLPTAIAEMQREYLSRSRSADSFDEWL